MIKDKKDKLEILLSEFEVKNLEKKHIFGGATGGDCTTGTTGETYCCDSPYAVERADDCDSEGCDAPAPVSGSVKWR
jgi:hypothetical protein